MALSFADQLWNDAGAPITREVFGVPVLFCQDSYEYSTTAIVDVVDYRVLDAGGLTSDVSVRDYTIRVSECKVNGDIVTPRRGHVIKETINGVSCSFEVMPISDNSQAVELQADGENWILHTKQIGAA